MKMSIPLKDLKRFCTNAGIKIELKVSYNTQKNGVAERKNMALVRATKAMIHD